MKYLFVILYALFGLSAFAQTPNAAPKKKMIKVRAEINYSASFKDDTTYSAGGNGFTEKYQGSSMTTRTGQLSLSGEWEVHEDKATNSILVSYDYDPADPVDHNYATGHGEITATGGYDEKAYSTFQRTLNGQLEGGEHRTDVTSCTNPGKVNIHIQIFRNNYQGFHSSFSIGAEFKGTTVISGDTFGPNPEQSKSNGHVWHPIDDGTPSDALGGVGASDNDDAGNKSMKIVATPTGYRITGQYSETYGNGKKKETTMYSVTLGEPEYEVELVPVDEVGYEKWIPEGPDMHDKGAEYPGIPQRDTKKGNAIAFKVNVYERQTHVLVTPECIATYKLTQVSHIPGWCGNYPSENPDATNDMSFFVPEKDESRFDKINELAIVTKKEFGNTDVWVISYDYGGYAELSAAVKIEGKEYTAKAKTDKRAFMKIPYCEGDSKIAAEWKKQNKCLTLKDADDNEPLKNGMGDHEGDGYTVFEEYRGFSENREHIRTDPMKKDVMIYDEYKQHMPPEMEKRAEDGIILFSTATQTNVHYKFLEDEFGKTTNDPKEGTPRDKILNFNNVPSLHSVDQHGLWIHFNPVAQGYAVAVLKNPRGGIGTPRRYQYLDITSDFDPSAKGYATTQGTINPNQSVTGGAGQAKIITDEFAVTVAHEMLHCCNVKHHGDGKDFGTWRFISGKQLVGRDPNKIYGAKTSDTTNTGQVNIAPVNLYDETNSKTLLKGDDARFQVWVRLPVAGNQGTCSGVEDCIMRYDNARAVKKPNGNIYILPQQYEYAELSGIYLCGKKEGTGVNVTGRVPFSRYGDADAGRGNCKSLFCVNDKYH